MTKYTDNMVMNAVKGNVFDFKDNYERAISNKLDTAIKNQHKVIMGDLFTRMTAKQEVAKNNENA